MRTVITGALVMLIAAVAIASRTALRAQSQAPLEATGLILGRVVDAETGKPVPAVTVTLAGDSAAVVAQMPPPRRVLTDIEGRFVFRQLPKGAYQLTTATGGNGFTPNGFIVTGMGFPIAAYLNGGYGQRRPDGPTQSIDLAAGEKIGDAVIRLWRAGSVGGTVIDDAGEPLVGIVIGAVAISGDGQLLQGPTTKTDDRGMYHIGGLTPGNYLVFVPQVQVLMPSSTVEALLTGPPDDMASRRFLAAGAPSPTLSGIPAGSSVLATGTTGLSSNGLPPRKEGDRTYVYQTAFHPSATVTSKAQVVAIRSGEDRTGVDVQLRPVVTAAVSGTLVDGSGPVGGFGAHVMPADAQDGSSVLEVATTATDSRGVFVLRS